MRARALAIAIFGVVACLTAVWLTHSGPVPRPVIAQARGHCVLNTARMRRIHMMWLRQVRTQVVRYGVPLRTDRLTRCISCHVQRNAQGQAIPINAPGQFCSSCHVYVGVKIDCFACHAAVPEPAFAPGHISGAHHIEAAFRWPRVLPRRFKAPLSGGVS